MATVTRTRCIVALLALFMLIFIMTSFRTAADAAATEARVRAVHAAVASDSRARGLSEKFAKDSCLTSLDLRTKREIWAALARMGHVLDAQKSWKVGEDVVDSWGNPLQMWICRAADGYIRSRVASDGPDGISGTSDDIISSDITNNR